MKLPDTSDHRSHRTAAAEPQPSLLPPPSLLLCLLVPHQLEQEGQGSRASHVTPLRGRVAPLGTEQFRWTWRQREIAWLLGSIMAPGATTKSPEPGHRLLRGNRDCACDYMKGLGRGEIRISQGSVPSPGAYDREEAGRSSQRECEEGETGWCGAAGFGGGEGATSRGMLLVS